MKEFYGAIKRETEGLKDTHEDEIRLENQYATESQDDQEIFAAMGYT